MLDAEELELELFVRRARVYGILMPALRCMMSSGQASAWLLTWTSYGNG